MQTEKKTAYVSYIHRWRKNLAKIHELARKTLLEASDHQKRQYDIRSNTNYNRQGDKVLSLVLPKGKI